MHALKEGSKGN